ncbi:MAG: valine--tRNA ligase, partial [Verrucomicrobia bacterium]|nr:valine--tRNA ligase [Verrucomicrobiota bacterium]
LGASCDWERERFTMDDGLSDAVAEVFVRLYEKGLIYRANYIINWCPRCQTALSDEESEHQDTAGHLFYIRYPVEGVKGLPHIVVATTRPETLLGDVAVAINPKDARYRKLVGATVRLPFLDRALTVIEDDFVDPAFGTGVVKVTPAHDPNDFDMGRRHGLTPISVMNPDGTMNTEAGPYAGDDRFACRKRLLKDLESAGLLEKTEKHNHAIGHCYRCDTVIEPRLSPQWFVKMQPLAGPAIEAVTSGKIAFVPGRWTKVYLDWMENIRDWCISRQIWWGHRIPVFTCTACEHVWAAKGSPTTCPACQQQTIEQDPDVLDTWFSSWLWPFSTFGWPAKNADLATYYPTHDLATASEIIFFWVARMIMAGYEFMGDVPFTRVYIHGTVRDDKGRKMSKSLGNSIDPLTIIDEYSADALRFSLMMITATGQDVYLSDDKFEIGRNFGTKIWNAARFLQMHGGEDADGRRSSVTAPAFEASLMTSDDKHMLSRVRDAVAACTEHLEAYRFNDAALTLYEFVWHQFCDWYVEYAKSALYGDRPERKAHVLGVMHYVLATAVRLLHPMMPFITEELWHAMGYADNGASIMRAPWPAAPDAATLVAWGITADEVSYVEHKHELVRTGRMLRADYGVAPGKLIGFMIKATDETTVARLTADIDNLKSMLKADVVTIAVDAEPNKAAPSGLSALGTIYMPLAGVIDVDSETQRLTVQLKKITGDLERTAAKLNNKAFVSKAPADVVSRQKARKQELIDDREKLTRLLATLANA